MAARRLCALAWLFNNRQHHRYEVELPPLLRSGWRFFFCKSSARYKQLNVASYFVGAPMPDKRRYKVLRLIPSLHAAAETLPAAALNALRIACAVIPASEAA